MDDGQAQSAKTFSAELSRELIASGDSFDVIVHYPQGTKPAPVNIALSDPAGALSFTETHPPSAGEQRMVKDGKLTVSFRAQSNQLVWVGKPKALPFTVNITTQAGETQTLSGEVLAKALLPVWALPVLGIFLLCLVGGSLFLIVPRLFPPESLDTDESASFFSTLAAQGATSTIGPTESIPPAPEETAAAVIIPTQVVATDTPLPLVEWLTFASDRSGNWEIYVMEGDESSLRRLTDNPAEDSFPVWSPDGSQILFHSNRNGNFDIFVMNSDGSGLRQLTSDARADTFPSWSPDGTQIVFQSKRDGPKQIYVMNSDGSGQTRLTHTAVDDQFPSWSPDGEWIVYSSVTGGGIQLYLMAADGSDQRPLTGIPQLFTFPTFSPDGKWLLYDNSTVGIERLAKAVIDAPSGTLGEEIGLTDASLEATHPRWSPDGKAIYFMAEQNGDRNIYRMDSDGNNIVQLTINPAQDVMPSVILLP